MKRTESAEVRFSSGKAVEPNIYRSKYAAVHRLYSRVKGGGGMKGGGGQNPPIRAISVPNPSMRPSRDPQFGYNYALNP